MITRKLPEPESRRAYAILFIVWDTLVTMEVLVSIKTKASASYVMPSVREQDRLHPIHTDPETHRRPPYGYGNAAAAMLPHCRSWTIPGAATPNESIAGEQRKASLGRSLSGPLQAVA